MKSLVYEAEKETEKPKKQVTDILAPADGKLVPMNEIPDTVFSSGTLGECAGIIPDNGTIYSPCDGVVSGIADTGHAVTITSTDGKNILVHVGIDTVTLNGKGFRTFVKAGDSVSAKQKIMEANLDIIKNAGLSAMVITVLCN